MIVCNFACSWESSAYSAQERTASFSPMWRGGVLFCSQHRPWTILGESRPDSEATGRLIARLPVLTVVDGCWWTRWKITFGGWCNMMQLLDPKKQRSPWFAKKHQKTMFFPHCLYIIRVCIGNSMTVWITVVIWAVLPRVEGLYRNPIDPQVPLTSTYNLLLWDTLADHHEADAEGSIVKGYPGAESWLEVAGGGFLPITSRLGCSSCSSAEDLADLEIAVPQGSRSKDYDGRLRGQGWFRGGKCEPSCTLVRPSRMLAMLTKFRRTRNQREDDWNAIKTLE